MTERTTRSSVSFARPFHLSGVEGIYPPGTYAIEVSEEPIEGMSFVGYRRTQTTIELPRTPRMCRGRSLKLNPPIWKQRWREIWRQAMANPRAPNSKFKVGQTVDFSPSLRGLAASTGLYKVTRILPTEGRERLYRIKTIAEAFERVVRESELLAASGSL